MRFEKLKKFVGTALVIFVLVLLAIFVFGKSSYSDSAINETINSSIQQNNLAIISNSTENNSIISGEPITTKTQTAPEPVTTQSPVPTKPVKTTTTTSAS